MISTTSKIFVFALAALSISALLSDDLELQRSMVTGVASLLATPGVTGEELRLAFISAIEPLSFGPVAAKDYAAALKLIVSHKTIHESKARRPADVEKEIKAIKDDLVKDLANQAETFKERLEESVGRVVTLMKQEFVYQLKNRKADQGHIAIANRVAELKASLKDHIATLYDKDDIDKNRKRRLVKKINDAVPDSVPGVEALVKAYNDNADLFDKPKETLEAVRDIQLGQLEADIAKANGAVPETEAVEIFQTTLDIASALNRNKNDLLFIETLIEELTAVARDQSGVFGPETTPEAVKGVQSFLAGLIRLITQTRSKSDKEFLGEVVYNVSNYFSDVLPRFYSPYYKRLQSHNIFEVAPLFSDLAEDDKSPEGLRFQKYINVIAATYKADKMSTKDMTNFIAKLDEYIDFSETEVKALGLLTDYFVEEAPVQFAEKPHLFWMAFVEFVEFISLTEQETLSKENVFSRFNQHLAGKADATQDSKTKWLFAALRIANFLQSPRNFELAIDPLDESEAPFFVKEVSNSLFDKTHNAILDLLFKESTEIVEALAGNSQTPANQRALSHWKLLTRQIETDRTEFANKKELSREEGSRFLTRVAKMLTYGLTFAAENRRLI